MPALLAVDREPGLVAARVNAAPLRLLVARRKIQRLEQIVADRHAAYFHRLR